MPPLIKCPDLPPAGPSFIMRGCRLDLGIRVPRLAQARRARSPQIAQALGALAAVFGCPRTSAVGPCCSRNARGPAFAAHLPDCRILLVQQLVPEAAIKAFNERILLRFSWIDVMPRHGVLVGPSQDGPTGELGPIVTDNATGLAVDPDQCAELALNPFAGEAGIQQLSTGIPRYNRRSPPEPATSTTRRSCQTRSPATSAHWDARQ